MKIKQLAAVLLAMCMTAALLPTTAFAVTSNTIYAVSYGHGVVSADTDSAAAGTVVTVTLKPDASRLHMGQGSTAIDPEPYVMQQQMEADMKYVSASPAGTVADVNSALPATSAYTAGTTVDSDDYSGAAAYYPTNFVFAITNDANATEISLTKINDTTYTFTMPDAAVKVVAGFGSVATEPAGARVPVAGSATQVQEGNPGDRTVSTDYAVEMRTDLKCLYYPSYLENVFDFTDGQTLHVPYPAEGANTYGSFLLSVLGVARDYSGTKQITVTVAQDPDTIEYRIDKGANGKWTKGNDSGLSFTANGEFSKFTGVKVNGKLISDSNYTAVLGSTVVTLKPAYLSTLSAGTYNLTIVFSDGEASTQFTIEAKAADITSPQTGDGSNMLLWVCLLFVSGAGVLAAVIYTKKKNHPDE